MNILIVIKKLIVQTSEDKGRICVSRISEHCQQYWAYWGCTQVDLILLFNRKKKKRSNGT
jgi:hypothetical protein